ncbi:Uncharacterized protein HZ326_7958 [Fusarium oxysporum f. sp. albedinis]|nr:Uncharacterized protein HZ326_7958 [Fusarium oxysporum f. sp. albedinis]
MPFNVFTTTVIAFLAAPALANPIHTLPVGLESHLESRAAELPTKSFQSGHCIKDLAGADHAVSMAERKKSSCQMIRYRQKNCQGCSQKGLNLYDCFNTGDEWKSTKFKC